MADPSGLAPKTTSPKRAPMVPLALAATVGIALDHFFKIPPGIGLVLALVAVVAWIWTSRGDNARWPVVSISIAIAALAAAYHFLRVEWVSPDDIRYQIQSQPRLVQLHGFLTEEPIINRAKPLTPLAQSWQSDYNSDLTRTEMRVTSLEENGLWKTVSGSVRVIIRGACDQINVGDEVQVLGRLFPLQEAANPGEFDQARQSRMRGVSAELIVASPENVRLINQTSLFAIQTWPARLRAHGQQLLADPGLPFSDRTRGLVGALLLGEGSTFTSADWDRFKRTGVVHALSISGQHLAVLGAFLWFVLRMCRVSGRRGAVVVALLLFAYALITGGRPPAMRSAITVAVMCGGLMLRRPSTPANDFAFAWLIVLLIDPSEMFNPGCQLSFLSVAVLFWGAMRWFRWPWFQETDPLDQLVDQARPVWLRWLRKAGWLLFQAYAVSALVWLAILPLLAFHYHVVPVIALLIGPPIALLASMALITGFLLLIVAAISPIAAIPLAWITHALLWLCDLLVHWADRIPGGHFHVGDIPLWWLIVFYVGLLSILMVESFHRHWRWLIVVGLGWATIGLLVSVFGQTPELRCTFLSVGHGCCTVLETPDGRVILYDVGSMGKPDVVRWQVAPFLRSRGINRVDEVILSHADMDHFNGLVQLLDFFPVGQVTTTPTFHEKPTDAVQFTLQTLQNRNPPISLRTVKAGDRLLAGDVVLDVLHPPEQRMEGSENARSLVLLVQHQGHRILLTGDLSEEGLKRVLTLPPPLVDVMMAPHHGSRSSNPSQLADWARPRWVISSQGPPRGTSQQTNPYLQHGARFLTTWEYGAVTVRSREWGLHVETFMKRIPSPD